jgi:UDP-N-acetylmuramate dehydrogenase
MISNALPNYDLTDRNTLALRAQSQYAVFIEDEDQLLGLFETAGHAQLPVRVLGGGSNVILGEHYAGITAIMASRGRKLTPMSGERVLLEVSAGENWHDLVVWTVQQGLWGLENLAGIPGTAGAAPIQNIGAYGGEVGDRFHSLVAFDRTTGSFVTLDREACRFAYRHSVFKEQPGRYVVTRVRLELAENGRAELGYRELSSLGQVDHPETVMNAVLKLRTAKLPDWRILGNAGSFFHNPVLAEAEAGAFVAEHPNAPAFPQPNGSVKLSAGWLIEQAGLKGYRLGPVGVSDQHALVLVNHGGASRTELMALADHVIDVVMERFGIRLNREPELI